MARLSWRRQPDETGLSKVCQSARDAELRYAGQTLGNVSLTNNGEFYFYGCGKNSLWDKTTYKNIDEAKAECKKWVLSSDEYKSITRK